MHFALTCAKPLKTCYNPAKPVRAVEKTFQTKSEVQQGRGRITRDREKRGEDYEGQREKRGGLRGTERKQVRHSFRFIALIAFHLVYFGVQVMMG